MAPHIASHTASVIFVYGPGQVYFPLWCWVA
eukprot:SAG31_NODE_25748_length_455_cov_0.724719_1_plen_30_part_10